MRNGYDIMLAKQVYHTACRISCLISEVSLKNELHYGIIHLDKLEFDGQFDENIVGATIRRPRAADCRPYNTG